MSAAQLINQTSGNVEYYTPAGIVGAARATMGGIDLDPASSVTANRIVKAARFFTAIDDGLRQPWAGRVWMNHPFGRNTNGAWVNKLVNEYRAGHVTQAVMICFASTSEGWFQPLFDYALCFLSPRTNYYAPDGSMIRGVTKGSVTAYLGPHVDRFARHFAGLGRVLTPYQVPGTQCVICEAGVTP